MEFNLPLGIVSTADISRLLRELASLEQFFISAQARSGKEPVQPPRLTRLLDQTAQQNKLNLIEASHRAALKQQLELIQKTAPSLHISFATDPPAKIIERILDWLRKNIHHQTLLQVGLQPGIAAGCVLRTPNKIFDMSLRKHMESQRDYLGELIKGAISGRSQ